MRMLIQIITVVKIFFARSRITTRVCSRFAVCCLLVTFGLCTAELSPFITTRAGKQKKKENTWKPSCPEHWGQGRRKNPCPLLDLLKEFAQTQRLDLLLRSTL